MATKSKAKAVKKQPKKAVKKTVAKTKSVAPKASSKKVVKKSARSAPVVKKTVKKTAPKASKASSRAAVAKKSAAKTSAKKKSAPKAAKKTAAKQPVSKKSTVKKPAKKQPAAKKVAAKKSTAKKSAPAKSKPSRAALPPVRKDLPPVRPLASKPGRSKRIKPLSAKELEGFRKDLLALRDQVVDGISFLSGDNLNRSQRDASGDLSGYSLHMADQGTDNYDREFALNMVSTEQDLLYEIDEAIRRIDAGTFGICELSGEPIERARLKVIPYARLSVVAQSEVEKGQKRYRPFGPTLSR